MFSEESENEQQEINIEDEEICPRVIAECPKTILARLQGKSFKSRTNCVNTRGTMDTGAAGHNKKSY